MAGKKGSSPNVYKYYKIEGDKAQNTKKSAHGVAKVFLWGSIKTDEPAANVV